MKTRHNPKALKEAEALANERASLFALHRRTAKGEALTGFKLEPAGGAVRRRTLLEKGARPVLPTSAWDEIYREVGLR
jgi:hypothetical protein